MSRIRKSCLGIVCLTVLLLGLLPGNPQAEKTDRPTVPRNTQRYRRPTTRINQQRKPSIAQEARLRRHLASRGLAVVRIYRRWKMSAYATNDGSAGKWTASHTLVRHGTIAADPAYLTRGTKVYIPNYGYGIVRDVGRDIKRHRLDLGFRTPKEAKIYGRKVENVYVLAQAKR